MINVSEIPELEIDEYLYQGPHSLIAKVRNKEKQSSEILKVLKTETHSKGEVVRLHQEYLIAAKVDSPYVAKVLEIVEKDSILALRMEDIGAQSLAKHIAFRPITLENGLEIAISISRGLQDIHREKVAHKDINSGNIIWNPDTHEVQIIDFGIASMLDKDLVAPNSPHKLDGNLAYLSPEQTGRMNRPVDFRTDFYSMGVTLFEIFTGKLPFTSLDPLELIHAHIAKPPPSPRSLNPRIPEVLEKLILKLMEKNVEKRYQNALGVEQDLLEILEQSRNKEQVENFELGTKDYSDRFLIPSKLYGRSKDVAALIQTFNGVCSGEMKLSLVSGYSGVGKTSLVQELYRPLAIAKGRYISGKFDQYQRDVPYSALAYAFNGFCSQILAESKKEISVWKDRILDAVGNNGQVLIEVVPYLSGILGSQPPAPEVDPQAAKNRFNQVLHSFMSSICSPENPLVLFLDNLQWIDQASLEYLRQILLNDTVPGLHLVGAYRDNEVEDRHPLSLLLGELDKARVRYDVVHLGNLNIENLTELVSDTLSMPSSEVTDLVDLIYRKTSGNAFFATEFFKNLHSRSLLYHQGNLWRWDTRKIEEENMTENVVDFMAGKLRTFSSETENALKYAACIGNEFDLQTLAIILQNRQGYPKLFDEMYPAMQTGVIRALNEEYKKIGIMDVQAEDIRFKFQHDRVQQAAYSLIPPEDRPEIHLQIGRLLARDATKSHAMEERLFEIVSHLNQATHIVNTEEERISIAELNYKSGIKALSAAAYQASVEYFHQALELLPEDGFSTHYELMYKTHLSLAKSLYINGQFELSVPIYPIMVENVASVMDEVQVRMVQMEDFHLQGDYDKAIEIQKIALELLGEDFPEGAEALEESILREMKQVPIIRQDRSYGELLEVGEMDAPEVLAKLRILAGMWMSAYLVSRDGIVQWCSVRMTNLTLEYGNSQYASFAYVQYAYLCILRLEEPEQGREFGDLAVQLADRYDNVEMRGRVYFNFAIFVNHWTRHVSTSTDLFRKAYGFSIEAGDWTYAVYGAANILSNLLIEGRPCADVYSEGEKYYDFLHAKAEVGLKSFFLPGGYVPLLDLMDCTEENGAFDCEYMQEKEHLETLGKLPIVEAWFYSSKLRSLFLFRRMKEARKVYHKPDVVAEGVRSQIKIPEACLYACLIIADSWSTEKDASVKENMLRYFDQYA